MKNKKISITDLKPAGYNPRKITDEQLKRLKKSLQEFGDLSGIVFNCRTGNLIGGHQRIKCLPPDVKIEKKELKGKTRTGTVAEGYIILPSVIPAGSKRESREEEKYTYREVDWPIEKEKAANIAANKHSGDWDEEKLGELLKELSEMPNFDFEVTGFDSKEMDKIITEFEKNNKEEDFDADVETAKITEQKTRRGVLHFLGRHRLLWGDSTIKEEVERFMDGKKANMVFTPPPYGINIVKISGQLSGKHPITGTGKIGGSASVAFKGKVGVNGIVKCNQYRPIIGDDKSFDPSFLLDMAQTCIIWGANNFHSLLPENPHWIVWDKHDQATGLDHKFFGDCELAWTNVKRIGVSIYRHLWKGLCRAGNRKEESDKRLHPTQKPVNLLSMILNDYSQLGGVILDLFVGSGSTLIAAEKIGRICYGMEIDPLYCDVIVQRWEKFTGKTAVLEARQEPILVKKLTHQK